MTITTTEIMVVLGVLGFLFAVYKWVVFRLDKRQKEYEEAIDKKTKVLEDKIEVHEAQIGGLRNELRGDYIHKEAFVGYRAELRDDFKQIFDELRSLTSSVGEINGYLKGREEHDRS